MHGLCSIHDVFVTISIRLLGGYFIGVTNIGQIIVQSQGKTVVKKENKMASLQKSFGSNCCR